MDNTCTEDASLIFPTFSVRTGTKKYPNIMNSCDKEKITAYLVGTCTQHNIEIYIEIG